MGKGKDLLEKGPGDAKDSVKMPSWRGESGKSDAEYGDETESVHYER